MINYSWEYIQSHSKETRRLLGINYEQLEDLIEYAKLLEQRHKQEQEKQKLRINKPGGGREAKISREEQIILTLIYLRHHLTFQLLG